MHIESIVVGEPACSIEPKILWQDPPSRDRRAVRQPRWAAAIGTIGVAAWIACAAAPALAASPGESAPGQTGQADSSGNPAASAQPQEKKEAPGPEAPSTLSRSFKKNLSFRSTGTIVDYLIAMFVTGATGISTGIALWVVYGIMQGDAVIVLANSMSLAFLATITLCGVTRVRDLRTCFRWMNWALLGFSFTALNPGLFIYHCAKETLCCRLS